MRLLLLALFTFFLSTNVFAAKTLDETNIAKMLDAVKIAKEHKNIKAMQKHFLGRTSVSLTDQNIDTSETQRFTFSEYKRYLSRLWKKAQSNLIEVQERSFDIKPDGKSALVKTTLSQTLEIEGVKTETTIYETTGIKLIKGKIYIDYYSARKMLHTSMQVN